MSRPIMRGLLVAGLAAAAALAALAVQYRLDMDRAYERIANKSHLISSPYGKLEFTQGGTGPDVLVIHGSGGGFDQAELIAKATLGEAFRWIAPSRFGYLRSTAPSGATFSEQAHAYAHLLDHLGVQRAAVVALSHGGPSAILLAALHPDRVSSLILVSAGVASSAAEVQSEANQKGNMLTTVFSHDLLYWLASTWFERQLMQLMGANEEVAAGLDARQRQLVEELIEFMNPVAPRSAGVVFDNTAEMPNEWVSLVRAPTLIFHAEDDGLQLFHNAEFAAAHIPGAELRRFQRGGHLLLAVEEAAIRAAVEEFILLHAGARDQQ